jgi:lipopolysaccharide/colanic/teichoic acid biosynthesis glycosyltransferase
VYGTFDDVADAVDAAEADTVVVLSCPELDGIVLRRLAWRLERDEVDLVVAQRADRRGRAPDHDPAVRRAADAARRAPRLHGGVRVVKELFDRCAALSLLALLGPLLLAVALCVRITSRGAGTLSPGARGPDGREFRIFKFRSMYVDAEARLAELRHLNEHDGVLFKIRDDPRVTRVGRWMRRFSLDELAAAA